MINLYISILLFAASCLAAFIGFHENNRATAFMLTLGSIIYLFASIWKLFVFIVWLVKYLF